MISVGRVDQRNIDEVTARLIEEVGFIPEKGRGIFIKPNVVIGTADTAIITSPQVVESLLKYFSGHTITIGERSAVGVDTYRALERSGYGTLAQRYGVELVDLGRVKRVKSLSLADS